MLILLSMLAALAPALPNCAAVVPLLAAGQACRDAPHGIAIAATPARAAALATIAASGERRFAQHFGRETPAYAVVEMAGTAADPALDARLAAPGVAWRLPWLSPDAMTAAYQASIRRAAQAKAASLHLDPAQTAGLVAAALAQQTQATSPAGLGAREAGTLPHELGHGWFIRSWWPGGAVKGGDHYGGPAPDWMDETAAVLMENDAFAARRREQFAVTYRGTDAAARTRLLDLTTFLSGGHPALPVLNLPAGGTGGVRVLTGAEAAGVAAAAGGFYLQARMFADYVIGRSGDPTAFRTAAASFAKGLTTAQWLDGSAKALHLPATLPALQRDWEKWLAAKLPAAG